MLTLPQRRKSRAAQNVGLADPIAKDTNLRQRLAVGVGRLGQLPRLELNLTQTEQHLHRSSPCQPSLCELQRLGQQLVCRARIT